MLSGELRRRQLLCSAIEVGDELFEAGTTSFVLLQVTTPSRHPTSADAHF